MLCVRIIDVDRKVESRIQFCRINMYLRIFFLMWVNMHFILENFKWNNIANTYCISWILYVINWLTKTVLIQSVVCIILMMIHWFMFNYLEEDFDNFHDTLYQMFARIEPWNIIFKKPKDSIWFCVCNIVQRNTTLHATLKNLISRTHVCSNTHG